MTDRHERFLDLCAGYALDALSPEERRELEAHLPGCAICRDAVASFEGVTPALGLGAVAAVPPPPAVRANLLAAIGEGAAPPGGDARGTGGCWKAKLLAAVAILTAIGLAIGWIGASRRVRELEGSNRLLEEGQRADAEREREASRRIDELEGLLRTRDDELARLRDRAVVMAAPGAVVAGFTATEAAGEAATTQVAGRVVYDSTRRKAVVVFVGLAAPASKDYELWAIDGAGPRSLGVVRADADGRALLVVDVETADTPAAFAISLEARGGAPAGEPPQGPVGLVASLGS